MRQPTCRACGVHIQFGITVKGKRMPIDVAASDDGNVVFDDDGSHVTVLKRGEATERPRFHSHFETCPKGAAFRSRQSKAKPPREALAAAMATPEPAPEPVQEQLL